MTIETNQQRQLIVERQGAVAVLTLNRPERRNALSLDLRQALLHELKAIADDSHVRAIVLTGAAGHFCSGGDIGQMSPNDPKAGPRDTQKRVALLHDLARQLISGPKPVVAAVEGSAFGAGLSLALACDHVVGAHGLRMCASFLRVGLMADTALLWTLPLRVGVPASRDLLLSARQVDADEAMRLRLVDELTPAGGALEKALEKAHLYAQGAPLAVAATKAALAFGTGSLEDALSMEAGLQIGLTLTQDHKEGVSAFLEKRRPAFIGR